MLELLSVLFLAFLLLLMLLLGLICLVVLPWPRYVAASMPVVIKPKYGYEAVAKIGLHVSEVTWILCTIQVVWVKYIDLVTFAILPCTVDTYQTQSSALCGHTTIQTSAIVLNQHTWIHTWIQLTMLRSGFNAGVAIASSESNSPICRAQKRHTSSHRLNCAPNSRHTKPLPSQ